MNDLLGLGSDASTATPIAAVPNTAPTVPHAQSTSAIDDLFGDFTTSHTVSGAQQSTTTATINGNNVCLFVF